MPRTKEETEGLSLLGSKKTEYHADYCPDILQIRFIQKSWDLIHVQIVRDQDAKMTQAELEEYLVTSLNRIFKKPFSFEFEWMQVIPPDPNGKLRMIVCETA